MSSFTNQTTRKVPQSRGMSASLRRLAARCPLPALAGGLLLAMGGGAQAAVKSWDPGHTPATPSGGAGVWDLNGALNWAFGGSDTQWTDAAGTVDTAQFGGTAGPVTLDMNLGALGLQFLTAGYTLNGAGTLTLGTGGIDAGTLTSGTTTLGNALTLAGAQTWQGGTGHTLLVNGPVANGGFLLTVSGGGNTTLGSAAVLSGAGGLTKSGAGILTLLGSNTYTGATTINAGSVVNIQNANALGDTASGTTIANGGALQLQGGITTAAEALSLSGGGISVAGNDTGALRNVSGNNSYTGVITLTGISRFNSDSGTLTLGTVTGVNQTLVLGGAGNILISGPITTGTGGLNKDNTGGGGTGAVTLTGANTYTGTTSVSAGTLTVGNGVTGSLNGTTGTALTVSGSGRFNVQEAAGSAQGMGALTFGAGDSIVQSTYGGSGATSLTFSSLAARAAGGTGNFVVSGGSNGSTNKIVLAGVAANSFINQGLFFAGSNYAFNDAGGFVRALNYATDAGAVSTGAAASVAGTFVQTTGPISAETTNTFSTLQLSGNNAFTLAGGATLTVNGILKTGNTAGGATISGGTGLQAANNTEMVIRTDGVNDALTINDAILVNGSSSLTKTGAGTLTLSGTNTYIGTTSVSGGTLKNGSATTFTGKGGLALSGTGVFDLNGFNAAVTNVSPSTFTTTITNNGAASATFTEINQGSTLGSLVLDGSKPLAVNLINANSGITAFALGNQNTFSGGLTLLDGSGLGFGTRLYINGLITTTGSAGAITSSPFGRGAITIGQTATDKAGILFDTVTNNTLANDIVFNTALGTDAPGIRLDRTGNVLSGTITGNLAPVTFSTGGALGGGATLTGQVTGPFGLVLDAGFAGGTALTVTLNNQTASPNNYQGNTIIGQNATAGRAMTLTLGAANQIPSGASAGNLVINSNGTGVGTLNLSGFNQTVNGLSGNGVVDGGSGTPTFTVGGNNATSTFSGTLKNTAGTLALNKTGTGALTLSGANTYTGGTTVSGGTLIAANSSALGVNSGLTVASGTNFSYRPTAAGALTLGAGALTLSGSSTVGTAVGGALGQSAITSSGPASATGAVTVDLTGIPGVAVTSGTNTLITTGGGLTSGGATYTLGKIYNATNFTVSGLSATDTAVSANVTSQAALTGAFWKGGFAGGSNVWAVSDGSTTSNWATDAAGTATSLVPGTSADVTFSAAGATNQGAMVLGANMAINSLTVNDPSTVTLNDDGNALTIASGITVNAGAGAVTLNPALTVGSAQTWTNNSANTLTLGGTVNNGANLLTTGGTGTIAIANLTSGAGGLTVSSGTANVTAATLTGAQTWTSNSTTTGLNAGAVTNGGFLLTVAGTGNSAITGKISGTGGLTKTGAGTLTLSGTNTYTGTTSVSGGTLKNGSATTFTGTGGLALSGTGVFDVNGFNAAVTSVSGSAATTITNNGAATATFTQTNQGSTFAGLVSDGSKTLALSFANNNSGTTPFTSSSQNTFSGGLTLLDGRSLGSGTRLRITGLITTTGSAGAITSSPFGRGAITIGQTATDKAGILFDTVTNNTLANDIVFNTALGTDAPGIRFDLAGNTLSGKITANQAAATFSSGGAGSGSVALTGQVTGPFGLALDASNGALAVTLNNQTATPNNYQGNTVIGQNATAGRSMTLMLGAANQIPSGASAGNLIINSNGTGVGTLNLAGFNQTVNGLSGNGVVDGGSGTPTFTVGGNNATSAFSGVIKNTAGSLALNKTGAGTLTLSGASTYTGATTINGGVVSVDSAGSTTARLTATSGVTVNAGAALQLANSSGTASADRISDTAALTLNNGQLQTGGNGETLGALNWMSTTTDPSTLSLTRVDFGSAVSADQLVFASLAGAAGGGATPLGTGVLDITNWDQGTDQFVFQVKTYTSQELANIYFVNPGGLASGTYTAQQNAVTGEVTPFGQIAPTPEPGGIIPIFIGAAGMGLLVARKRRAKALAAA